jgi:hypothetical protein
MIYLFVTEVEYRIDLPNTSRLCGNSTALFGLFEGGDGTTLAIVTIRRDACVGA